MRSLSDPVQKRILTKQKIGRPGIGPVKITKNDMLLRFEEILFLRTKSEDGYIIKIKDKYFSRLVSRLTILIINMTLIHLGINYIPLYDLSNRAFCC